MTVDQIKQFMLGEWTSIAPELRPSTVKNEDGSLKPFYLTRQFTYKDNDVFELEVTNFADPYGKAGLAKMNIRGHITWQGDHPIVEGAQKVEFRADELYEVTPLHAAFADVLNQFAGAGFNHWEINHTQSIFKKSFPVFGLAAGYIFSEYDLIYTTNDCLFWGARHIDGRSFTPEENRPTNLQIPLIRKK